MGAPTGHPFFGNQYTNGGYVRGSFSYHGAAGSVAKSMGEAAASLSKPSAVRRAVVPAASAKGLDLPWFSITSLVAVGAVALIGGVATFVYLRSKSADASEPTAEGGDIASFGVCESCGEPLALSGPGELEQDESGDFVTCENCSHQNRARYFEEEHEDQPESGSD